MKIGTFEVRIYHVEGLKTDTLPKDGQIVCWASEPDSVNWLVGEVWFDNPKEGPIVLIIGGHVCSSTFVWFPMPAVRQTFTLATPNV